MLTRREECLRALSDRGKYLLVGDPHATAEELRDCEALSGLVLEVAKSTGAVVILLGDQHHNHSLVHLGVMDFWRRFLSQAQQAGVPVVAHVGNHDRAADGDQYGPHAMQAYEELCLVVDFPLRARGMLLLPYYHSADDMVTFARQFPCETLLCHATLVGCVGDDDFPIPGGVDPNLLPQNLVISGHIHRPQSFGKVWYPGAPRWRYVSDAGADRAIWLVEVDPQGKVTSRTPFSTGGACRRIEVREDRPEAELDVSSLVPGVDWRVDVYGSPERCRVRGEQLRAADVRFRTFPDRDAMPAVRESEGVTQAFRRFLGGFKAKGGTSPETLIRMAGERLGG